MAWGRAALEISATGIALPMQAPLAHFEVRLGKTSWHRVQKLRRD